MALPDGQWDKESIIANKDAIKPDNFERTELKEYGSIILPNNTWFLHGSTATPKQVRSSGGLSPGFAREFAIRQKPSGVFKGYRYLLAFLAKNNVRPTAYRHAGAAAQLWPEEEFRYIYVFSVTAGTKAYQLQPANAARPQFGVYGSSEVAFRTEIPWASITDIFQYKKSSGKYVRSPALGNGICTIM